MQLQYGSHDEHVATIQRAKENSVTNVWTGDLKRKPYLAENLNYCESIGLIETEFVSDKDAQESYYLITYKF